MVKVSTNMKVKTAILTAAALSVFLSGCAYEYETGGVSETSAEISETEETSASPYLLVRGWEGKELLDSLFYCGEKRPLPMNIEDTGFAVSDGNLIFPDGSYAEAYFSGESENTVVTALRFRRESAPADFSVYGVDFGTLPDDIPETVGIANSVYGNEETVLTHSFYGGGLTELTFIFKEKVLSEIYIAS